MNQGVKNIGGSICSITEMAARIAAPATSTVRIGNRLEKIVGISIVIKELLLKNEKMMFNL
jgi:hypothetical protein